MTDIGPRESEMFDFIVDGVDNLKNIIDNIMDYSKFSANELDFEEVDFEKLFDKLEASLDYDIQNENVSISRGNLSNVYGHEESIYLVFQNLLSNAIKYQPKNEKHQPKIEITQVTKDNMSIISVEDNGIGIDQSGLTEIFLPFKRFHSNAEYEGTGLGMSIVKKIIEKHKGRIEAASEVGKGSKFTVFLPVLLT